MFLWIIQQEELKGRHPTGVTRTSYSGNFQWYFDQGKWNLLRVSGEFELAEFELSGFYCTLTCIQRVVFGLLTVSWDMSTDSSPPPPPPFPPHLSPDISINVLRDKLREFDKRSKRFPINDHFINSPLIMMDIVRRKLMLITLGLIKHYLKFTYQDSASQSLIPALKKRQQKLT